MSENETNTPETCAETRAHLQDYLDGTLSRKASMALFLHVRECAGCRRDLEELEALFGRLGALEPVEAPEDFDARILASVPYEAYKAMEPLRRERVPVFLEEEALPAWLRARVPRVIGGLIAVATAVGLATDAIPEGWASLGLLGALPAVLVGVQNLTRRIYVGVLYRTAAH